MTFICQANSVLFQCNGCDSATKMQLFYLTETFCLSLYGCTLWRLNAHDLHSLNASFNNAIYCSLCRTNHKCLQQQHVFKIHQTAFYYVISPIQFHSICISCQLSSMSRYNCLYGNSHCRSYQVLWMKIEYLLSATRSSRPPKESAPA